MPPCSAPPSEPAKSAFSAECDWTNRAFDGVGVELKRIRSSQRERPARTLSHPAIRTAQTADQPGGQNGLHHTHLYELPSFFTARRRLGDPGSDPLPLSCRRALYNSCARRPPCDSTRPQASARRHETVYQHMIVWERNSFQLRMTTSRFGSLSKG